MNTSENLLWFSLGAFVTIAATIWGNHMAKKSAAKRREAERRSQQQQKINNWHSGAPGITPSSFQLPPQSSAVYEIRDWARTVRNELSRNGFNLTPGRMGLLLQGHSVARKLSTISILYIADSFPEELKEHILNLYMTAESALSEMELYATGTQINLQREDFVRLVQSVADEAQDILELGKELMPEANATESFNNEGNAENSSDSSVIDPNIMPDLPPLGPAQ